MRIAYLFLFLIVITAVFQETSAVRRKNKSKTALAVHRAAVKAKQARQKAVPATQTKSTRTQGAKNPNSNKNIQHEEEEEMDDNENIGAWEDGNRPQAHRSHRDRFDGDDDAGSIEDDNRHVSHSRNFNNHRDDSEKRPSSTPVKQHRVGKNNQRGRGKGGEKHAESPREYSSKNVTVYATANSRRIPFWDRPVRRPARVQSQEENEADFTHKTPKNHRVFWEDLSQSGHVPELRPGKIANAPRLGADNSHEERFERERRRLISELFERAKKRIEEIEGFAFDDEAIKADNHKQRHVTHDEAQKS